MGYVTSRVANDCLQAGEEVVGLPGGADQRDAMHGVEAQGHVLRPNSPLKSSEFGKASVKKFGQMSKLE